MKLLHSRILSRHTNCNVLLVYAIDNVMLKKQQTANSSPEGREFGLTKRYSGDQTAKEEDDYAVSASKDRRNRRDCLLNQFQINYLGALSSSHGASDILHALKYPINYSIKFFIDNQNISPQSESSRICPRYV